MMLCTVLYMHNLREGSNCVGCFYGKNVLSFRNSHCCGTVIALVNWNRARRIDNLTGGRSAHQILTRLTRTQHFEGHSG